MDTFDQHVWILTPLAAEAGGHGRDRVPGRVDSWGKAWARWARGAVRRPGQLGRAERSARCQGWGDVIAAVKEGCWLALWALGWC